MEASSLEGMPISIICIRYVDSGVNVTAHSSFVGRLSEAVGSDIAN